MDDDDVDFDSSPLCSSGDPRTGSPQKYRLPVYRLCLRQIGFVYRIHTKEAVYELSPMPRLDGPGHALGSGGNTGYVDSHHTVHELRAPDGIPDGSASATGCLRRPIREGGARDGLWPRDG